MENYPQLSSATAHHATNAIAANLHTLVTDQRDARTLEAQRRAQEKIKPVSDMVGAQVTLLLKLCQVATPEQLPPIWQQLSSANKSDRLSIINSAVGTVIQEEAPSLTLNVTPTLKDKVIKLQFRMINRDDLTSGIQPFIFGTGSSRVGGAGSRHQSLPDYCVRPFRTNPT